MAQPEMAKPEMVSSTSAKSKWYIFTSNSCLERHEPQSLADEEMYCLALWKLTLRCKATNLTISNRAAGHVQAHRLQF